MSTKFVSKKDRENNTFAVSRDDDGTGVLSILNETEIDGEIYIGSHWYYLESNEQGITTAKQIVNAINEWIRRTENKAFK